MDGVSESDTLDIKPVVIPLGESSSEEEDDEDVEEEVGTSKEPEVDLPQARPEPEEVVEVAEIEAVEENDHEVEEEEVEEEEESMTAEFKCKFCPKIFKVSILLYKNNNNNNNNCYFQFQRRTALVNHEKSHATCSKCSQTFSGRNSKQRQSRHETTCSGSTVKQETGKVCKECGKTFNRPANRRRHEMTCMPVCPYCGKKFKNSCQRRFHLCPKNIRTA